MSFSLSSLRDKVDRVRTTLLISVYHLHVVVSFIAKFRQKLLAFGVTAEMEGISLSSPSSIDTEENSVLIANTNKLLSAVGIRAKHIFSVDELCRVAPSMFVAVFEALYQMRIEDVVRQPRSREDYIRNAQLVIDQLSDQIGIDLVHITGASIVDGDLDALNNLVHIFNRIVSLAR